MGKGEGWGEGQGEGGNSWDYDRRIHDISDWNPDHTMIGGNDWEMEFCNCCKSRYKSHCLCGMLCPCCQICQTADKLGKVAKWESGCLYSLLSFITPCIAILLLRNKVRDRYKIPGSTLGDICASWLCPCCASIQLANEVSDRTCNLMVHNLQVKLEIEDRLHTCTILQSNAND